MKIRLGLIAALAVCLAVGRPALSQDSKSGSIRWILRVSKSADDSKPGHALLFGEPAAIVLRVALENFEGPAVFGLESIQSRVQVTLRKEQMPVDTAVAVSIPDQSSSGSLNPGDGLSATIVVRRSDGLRFESGSYHLTLDLGGVISSLRDGSNQRWTGRAKTVDFVEIEIRPVRGQADEATYNDLEGNALLGEGKPREAIPYLQRFVELAPNNWRAHATLGAAFLRSNMYRDAIPPFERAMPLWREAGNPGSGVLRLDLARAYVAVGREPDARNLLRELNLSDEAIAARIARMQSQQPRR